MALSGSVRLRTVSGRKEYTDAEWTVPLNGWRMQSWSSGCLMVRKLFLGSFLRDHKVSWSGWSKLNRYRTIQRRQRCRRSLSEIFFEVPKQTAAHCLVRAKHSPCTRLTVAWRTIFLRSANSLCSEKFCTGPAVGHLSVKSIQLFRDLKVSTVDVKPQDTCDKRQSDLEAFKI